LNFDLQITKKGVVNYGSEGPPIHNNLAKLYVAVHHIGLHKSWNRVSKTHRELATALERKGSREWMICKERRVEL
jgi:hypothetical protein